MTTYRILAVDDDPDVCEAVALALGGYEFEVVFAHTAEDGAAVLAEGNVDLIVLDIGLPGKNGKDWCRELRATSDVPVIFLSGYDADMDRVIGLEIGADDYIGKPFNPAVLLARVRAVLRRVGRAPVSLPVPDASPPKFRLEMVRDRYDATWDGNALGLSSTEYDILSVMMRRPGKIYSRDEIKDGAYGLDVYVSDKTINSHITRIREKLAAHGVDPIEARRSVGYGIILALIEAKKNTDPTTKAAS